MSSESTVSRPALVIGMGLTSALGTGIGRTLRAMYAEEPPSPVLPSAFETELLRPVFAVPDLPRDTRLPGGFCTMLLKTALDEALDRAGLTPAELGRHRVGVAIGTTVACQLNDVPFYSVLRGGELPSAEPLRSYVGGSPAEWVRRTYGLKGPAVTVSNACASGTDAVGIAAAWLRTGLVDIAIAGGTDELNKVPYDGFSALGVCSSEPCRPFDAARSGLNLGEAAGVVILAGDAFRSRARFAVTGFGKTADAHHITQPEEQGLQLERAICKALADSGATAADVDFINAHGTGTQANDRVESRVFGRVFGPKVRFMSTKAMTGHTLGAAGAVECVLSLLMLDQGRLVRNHRFSCLSADMPVAPLAEEVVLDSPRRALSVSLAFGGSNSAVVLERIS